jgi:endonuclease YncB( thermonuclease family)
MAKEPKQQVVAYVTRTASEADRLNTAMVKAGMAGTAYPFDAPASTHQFDTIIVTFNTADQPPALSVTDQEKKQRREERALRENWQPKLSPRSGGLKHHMLADLWDVVRELQGK